MRHFELFSNIDCCYVKICTFAIIKNQFSRRWRHLTLSNGRFRSYDSRLRRNGSRMRRRLSSDSGIWSSRCLVTFNHWLGWSWPTSVLVTFLLRNEKSSQTWVHSRKKMNKFPFPFIAKNNELIPIPIHELKLAQWVKQTFEALDVLSHRLLFHSESDLAEGV